MSLYDRLVPAEALRFDRIHPMTKDDGPLLTEWEQQFYRLHPVLNPMAFVEPGPFTAYNRDTFAAAFREGLATPAEAFDDPPARSWLPWRKRR